MGCDFTALLKDLLGHENLCIVRDVNCPGGLVNQCNWRGSAKGLSLHLKEHGCVFIHAHPPLRAIRDKNEISFMGELHNTNGSTFFQFRGNRIVKPILLMSPAIYRMFPFLLIERSYNGRWVLNIWSLLNESSLHDCQAEIIITTEGGKVFSSKMKILSTATTSRSVAFSRGYTLILIDNQLFKDVNGDSEPRRLLSFEVRICTTETFRQRLNYSNSPGKTLLLSDYNEEVFHGLGYISL